MPDAEILSRLTAFVWDLRNRFVDGREEHAFALAWVQVARYREYLALCAADFDAGSAAYLRSFDAQQAAFAEHTARGETKWTLSEEEMILMEEAAAAGRRVHMPIEAFYLFAAILLDRLTAAVRVTLGPACGVSFRSSHSTLTRKLVEYSEGLGIGFPPRLIELAKSLESKEATFRDHLVQHQKNPRMLYGTAMSPERELRMAPGIAYPDPARREGPIEPSELPDAMIERIDEYLGIWLDVIEANLDRVGSGGTAVGPGSS